MNKKNEDGVTLTLLVITVIVMVILFNITISTSTELLRNTRRNKLKTMLYIAKSRAEILLDDYLFENDGDLSSVSDEDIKKSLYGNYVTNLNDLKNVGYEFNASTIPAKDVRIYCSWDESVLRLQGIETKDLTSGDIIIIQYNIQENEVDVASTKGFINEERVIIHSLKDL